jgi:hypothetical protein
MATTKPSDNGIKKTATKKAAAPKSTTAKTAASKTSSTRKKNASAPVITSASRLQMIEVAAYYIAEKHGFNHHNMDHWLAAEKEIDSKLNA